MTRSKYNVRTDKAGKVPESGVLRACLDLLAAEKIWFMRLNVGAVKIGNRFIRFAESGTADILAGPKVFDGIPRFLWIECKSNSGKQSVAQAEFQRRVEGEGQHYVLVRSSDDLKAWLYENHRK